MRNEWYSIIIYDAPSVSLFTFLNSNSSISAQDKLLIATNSAQGVKQLNDIGLKHCDIVSKNVIQYGSADNF